MCLYFFTVFHHYLYDCNKTFVCCCAHTRKSFRNMYIFSFGVIARHVGNSYFLKYLQVAPSIVTYNNPLCSVLFNRSILVYSLRFQQIFRPMVNFILICYQQPGGNPWIFFRNWPLSFLCITVFWVKSLRSQRSLPI